MPSWLSRGTAKRPSATSRPPVDAATAGAALAAGAAVTAGAASAQSGSGAARPPGSPRPAGQDSRQARPAGAQAPGATAPGAKTGATQEGAPQARAGKAGAGKTGAGKTGAGKTPAGKAARAAVQGPSGPRSARLFLTHVDPWSIMKQAFLLALALAAITLAAFATLWFALESAGVLDAITRTATDVGGDSGASISAFLSFSKVMGAALVVAGLETVLVTALATLFAFLYNLAVAIGGGIEITLSEDS